MPGEENLGIDWQKLMDAHLCSRDKLEALAPCVLRQMDEYYKDKIIISQTMRIQVGCGVCIVYDYLDAGKARKLKMPPAGRQQWLARLIVRLRDLKG